MSLPQHNSGHQTPRRWDGYVPAIDEFVMAPPSPPVEIEAQESPSAQQTQAGLIVIVASNLLVTGIIIGVLLWNGSKADEALVRGTRYFTVTTPFYLVIITGSLTKIVGRIGRELTERQRIKSYERVMVATIEWRVAIEATRMAEVQAHSTPAQLAQRIATLEAEALERQTSAGGMQGGSTFVAPYSNVSKAAHADTTPQVDTTAQEAIAWLNGLYDDLGDADRRKVHADGRLKVRMLGSSRGPGSRDAGLWLLHRGAIAKVPGGFALNMERFATRHGVRNLL